MRVKLSQRLFDELRGQRCRVVSSHRDIEGAQDCMTAVEAAARDVPHGHALQKGTLLLIDGPRKYHRISPEIHDRYNKYEQDLARVADAYEVLTMAYPVTLSTECAAEHAASRRDIDAAASRVGELAVQLCDRLQPIVERGVVFDLHHPDSALDDQGSMQLDADASIGALDEWLMAQHKHGLPMAAYCARRDALRARMDASTRARDATRRALAALTDDEGVAAGLQRALPELAQASMAEWEVRGGDRPSPCAELLEAALDLARRCDCLDRLAHAPHRVDDLACTMSGCALLDQVATADGATTPWQAVKGRGGTWTLTREWLFDGALATQTLQLDKLAYERALHVMGEIDTGRARERCAALKNAFGLLAREGALRCAAALAADARDKHDAAPSAGACDTAP